MPHFTEDWEENWREVTNPEMEFCPLHFVAHAIGKVSMTPIEMTREYLTNPDMREHMSALTIDADAVKKVQDDIYSNPRRWWKIFNKPPKAEFHETYQYMYESRGNWRQHKYLRQEYWYRMMNQGYSPADGPFGSRQYENYVGWMAEL